MRGAAQAVIGLAILGAAGTLGAGFDAWLAEQARMPEIGITPRNIYPSNPCADFYDNGIPNDMADCLGYR